MDKQESLWRIALVGILWILGPLLVLSIAASNSSMEIPAIFVLFGICVSALGFVTIWLGLRRRESERSRAELAESLAQVEHEIQVKEIVDAVKSTIKVRCRYCGTLNEEEERVCESCGGPL